MKERTTCHVCVYLLVGFGSHRSIECSAHLKLDSHSERMESAEARRGGKEMASEKGNVANCVAPPENTFVSQLKANEIWQRKKIFGNSSDDRH